MDGFDDVKEVKLPNKLNNGSEVADVTSIAASAFYNCSRLTDITIPDSVTSISRGAFSGCSGLTSITLPIVGSQRGKSGTSDSVFGYIFGTNSYTGSTRTKQYYSSGSSTYYYIPTALKTVTITNETIFGYGAFYGCSGLTSVTIPDSVTSIRQSVFEGCSTSLFDMTTIPGVKLVDGWAVGNTGAPSGDFDMTGIRGIGASAFSGCSGLTNVIIPNNITSIGERAFYGCSGLTSVTIPDSVTSIGSSAFEGCSGLTSVHITDLKKWCNISFGNYSANPLYSAHNFYLNEEKITDLVIPDGVTSIGNSAFRGYSSLTSVTIPDSVTSIKDLAFSGCSGLMSVTISDSVTSIGSYAFSGCSKLTNMTIPDSVTSIGNSIFSWCGSLMSVTIGNSVTSIGSLAFQNCSGLTSVTIGDSVTSIGDGAFGSCSGLTSVTIPDSVTSIGKEAFAVCSKLTIVEFEGNAPTVRIDAFTGVALGCKAVITSTATGFPEPGQTWNDLIVEMKS